MRREWWYDDWSIRSFSGFFFRFFLELWSVIVGILRCAKFWFGDRVLLLLMSKGNEVVVVGRGIV